MAYKRISPIPVVEGGTGDSIFTAYAVVCGGTTSTGALQSIASLGTSGQILTSNGASALPTFQNASASGITTIDGDTGSVTGSTVTIKSGNSTQNSGSSVLFSGSGTTLTFDVQDANDNVIIGGSAGNASISGNGSTGLGNLVLTALTSGGGNVALGQAAGRAIAGGSGNVGCGFFGVGSVTSGNFNIGVGYDSMNGVTTGLRNIGIGLLTGNNYTGAETDNILIGAEVTGTVGESNVLRVGNGTGTGTGQLNNAYISGINGNTVSGPLVNISSGNQLGVGAITSDTSGRVTNANQPAFRVYSSSTQTNATGDGTQATIAFDTAAYDQNSNFNTGTNTFVAPVTGVYMFCVSVFLTGVSVGTSYALTITTPNGGFVSPATGATALANASSQLALNSTIMDKITAGGSVTFAVTVTGGTKTVSIFANVNLTYAMGVLIC